MVVAQTVALRSLCVRDRVGAVIVNETNRIVSTGYNGPPQGYIVPYPMTEEGPWDKLPCNYWCDRGLEGPTRTTARSYTDCPSLHAEANALSVCDRSLRERGTLYVTSPICFNCAKLIANSGLLRVVVDGTHSAENHRLAGDSMELIKKSGLTIDAWTHPS